MKYRRIVMLAIATVLPYVFLPFASFAEDSNVKVSEVKDENKGSATISVGMPAEEVLNLLGEPERKRKMKASDGGFVEFWNYRRILSQSNDFQVIGAEMVEVWSPSLGKWIDVPEEIEELVQTTIIQNVELVMHKGKVLTFSADLDRDINVVGN